ncbi:MAG: substrate-binding domain-containing protein, partial [Actinomycetota bacterium]
AGAEAVCAEAGHEIQVIGISSPADLDRLPDPTARLERRTDALALVDIGLTRDRADELLRRGIPVGTIGFRVEGHLAVQLDDHGVGAIAADHLLEIGVRRPAMIAGVPDHPMRRRVPDLRADGFRSSLAAAGRPLVAVAADSFGVTGGQRAMASILDELGDDLPDGVFAMSDELAFGAIMELRARGITVGFGDGAVALVGVDDHEFAPVVELTTIRQDVASLGRTLALQLIDAVARLREPDARPAAVGATTPPPTTACDRVVTPPVALVRRGSTQPRRRSA